LKVAGFTIVRNAINFDYPVVESISSVLPAVDEFFVLVGKSDDETLELIRSIPSEKIRIHESVWDDSLREGGKVLAVETNKAFQLIPKEFDWAFYIQADEVLHEHSILAVRDAMVANKKDARVEGLLFDYRHFYGSYDYLGDSRRWYPKEVRVIRNDKRIYSFRDAQGFQKDGRPLRVRKSNAVIHHYGWVKPPDKQQAKQKSFHKMWHPDEWLEKHVEKSDVFDYSKIDSLVKFTGSHPRVMKKRIESTNWKFEFDPVKRVKTPFKYKVLRGIKKLTGWDIGAYKNYRII
jgi:hypothetical protein